MDIARTWHFGRTPESFGEDAFLAASMVASEVQAIQQAHIVVTLKHYAAYTQEQGRTGDPPLVKIRPSTCWFPRRPYTKSTWRHFVRQLKSDTPGQ